MPKAVVAYVPALHAGYLSFFRNHPGVQIYVRGWDFINAFPRLNRDLRALARGMRQLLSSLGISQEKPALMFEDRTGARAARSHLMQTGGSAATARNENSRRSTR